MAGFEFKLQSYLSVKEKIEDQKKLAYGKALTKLEEEKNEKLRMEEEKENLISYFKNVIENEGINPDEFRNYNRYIELMKKKIRDQVILINIAERTAEEKRLELVEAMKERKMLDTIKENDKIIYLKEQQKKEEKVIDEVVTYQYSKK